MSYYLDLFSPETYEAFSASDRSVSGFRERQLKAASRIVPGDILVCYMTKLSRWVGLLEVREGPFTDHTPLFYDEDDPFVVRFRVDCQVWLAKEKALPIREDHVWQQLSFTRDQPVDSSRWTGKLRASLAPIAEADGAFLEAAIRKQNTHGATYEVDEAHYKRLLGSRVQRVDKAVRVTVPEETASEDDEPPVQTSEAIQMQRTLAEIGQRMGMRIWIPKADRSRVLGENGQTDLGLIERLPLNYDETTLRTIENIDVLWLRGRSIKRAFEIEHTTSVYSGILRMADLLALQPNMDINLHIVAPVERREKVFQEIRRPVFSLLERGPLSEICTFLSYDSVYELANLQHLAHLLDSVIEDYAEMPED